MVHLVLPEAGIPVLPGSGHFPHLAQPQALANILASWADGSA